MAKLKVNPFLSDPHRPGELDRIKQSHEGMAHFAGTGPENTTCKTCSWYTKDRFCLKFRRMMMTRKSPMVPADTPSCKYYEVC
jgi:hypothetical protein